MYIGFMSSDIRIDSWNERWFQNVVLANRACGGGIVAWKGTNLTNAPGNRYGAYVSDSRIMRVRVQAVLFPYVVPNWRVVLC